MSFSLTKWYLDGVDDAGRVFIAYWARLAMGEMALTWHAVTVFAPDEPASHTWSIVPVAPPHRDGEQLRWRSEPLHLSLTAEPCHAPHEVRLLDGATGDVTWRGEALAARLRLEQEGHAPFEGEGYAECLTLTLAPWLLPIDSMEWGRWIADDRAHASTWFRWRGAHPLEHVVEDGRDAANPHVDGTSVTTATSTLEIAPTRQLERRSLREIIAPLPLIARVVPDSLLALEETTWLGSGTRRDIDGTTHVGWAIHETVRFR